jgi:hypothetical protein
MIPSGVPMSLANETGAWCCLDQSSTDDGATLAPNNQK